MEVEVQSLQSQSSTLPAVGCRRESAGVMSRGPRVSGKTWIEKIPLGGVAASEAVVVGDLG